MKQMVDHDAWGYLQSLVDTYGPVSRIHGFFNVCVFTRLSVSVCLCLPKVPWLHVYDTKALHSILVKDQDSFYRGRIINRLFYFLVHFYLCSDSRSCNSFGMLLFGPGLLSTSGITHKKQRKMLNPVFSGAHMRNLTPIFHEVSRKVRALTPLQCSHVSPILYVAEASP